MQKSGFTIIAEKLNYLRYLSHFRSIHRGAFFAEMKTTEPRKLLPESWGFLCPVHTPDGAPCGLLNHLSTPTKVVCEINSSEEKNLSSNHSSIHSSIYNTLVKLGVSSINSGNWDHSTSHTNYLTVVLDGRVVGKVSNQRASDIVERIRILKVKGQVSILSYIKNNFELD